MGNYIKKKYGAKVHKCYPKICSYCEKEYYVPKHFLEESKYCSKECSQISRRKQVNVKCDVCGKDILRTISVVKKSKYNFCSRKCKTKAQKVNSGEKFNELRPQHYGTGLTNYRERALEFYGEVCSKCGYCRNILALEVDHIDGNRKNNELLNLQVLCANCHKIKTFG